MSKTPKFKDLFPNSKITVVKDMPDHSNDPTLIKMAEEMKALLDKYPPPGYKKKGK